MLIERFDEKHVSRVRAFNQRLRDGGSSFHFEENPTNIHGLTAATNEIRLEHFLVIDAEGNVRGAYTLIFQQFMIGGSPERVAFLQIPISEGSVNSAFSPVGVLLLKDALRRSPLLFALGMGGIERPLPRLLRALGFSVEQVPFFFLVIRPRPFLRNATALSRRPLLRVASRIAANTGIGDLAFNTIHALRGFRAAAKRKLRVECAPEFGPSANTIWAAAVQHYSCISIRDTETLNYLYPTRDSRYHRLSVYDEDGLTGWAVVTDSQMRGHNHFGNMRVGTIANCLARPGREQEVILAATRYLRERPVDLIVSNQLHPNWIRALDHARYLSYRSNFAFALSPALRSKIDLYDSALQRVHINRGDGDGAYNL
ncbi:MAG: hypothetical protein JO356_00450 [Acidobacteria bacterium]|nr:hypothetical protein [Acidobacteriota bacterium]